MLRGKVTAVKAWVNEGEFRSVALHVSKLGKGEQTKPTASRRKETIKIMDERN